MILGLAPVQEVGVSMCMSGQNMLGTLSSAHPFLRKLLTQQWVEWETGPKAYNHCPMAGLVLCQGLVFKAPGCMRVTGSLGLLLL